ncbi:MAG TPA: hypothetical protein PL028_05905 [Bacteroidales bacterium]|nr:hypothetical protein [Bacteroidales bacterium]
MKFLNSIKNKYYLILLFIFPFNNTHAQWMSTSGEFSNNNLYCIYQQDSILYGGSDNQIILSYDSGKTWNNKLSYEVKGKVWRIIEYNNEILITTRNYNDSSRIYLLNIFDKKINQINTQILGKREITDIVTLNNKLIITTDLGIYIYNTENKKWKESTVGINKNNKNFFCVSIIKNTLYVGTRGKILTSNDEGETWNIFYEKFNDLVTNIKEFDNKLYVLTSGSGLYIINKKLNDSVTHLIPFINSNINTLNVMYNIIPFCCCSYFISTHSGVLFLNNENKYSLLENNVPKSEMGNVFGAQSIYVCNNRIITGYYNKGIYYYDINLKIE